MANRFLSAVVGAVALLLGGCHGDLVPTVECGKDADCDVGVCNRSSHRCERPQLLEGDAGDDRDVAVEVDDTLIDDFETDDNQVALVGGRNGYWFTAHDKTDTGSQTPAPEASARPVAGEDGGENRLHTFGSGFADWGAEIGTSFVYDTSLGGVEPYDGAKYSGVRFTYSSLAPVVFEVATTDTQKTIYGGTCVDSCEDGAPTLACLCEGHYEVVLPESPLPTTVSIRWSDLYQLPWAKMVRFDPTKLWGIQWIFPPGRPFDFWLDRVAFTKASLIDGGDAAPTPPPPIIVADFDTLGAVSDDPHFGVWRYSDGVSAFIVGSDAGQPNIGVYGWPGSPGLTSQGDLELEWNLQDQPDGHLDRTYAPQVFVPTLGQIDLSRYTTISFDHQYEHSGECESIAQFYVVFQCHPLQQETGMSIPVLVSSEPAHASLDLAAFQLGSQLRAASDCLAFPTGIALVALTPVTDGACSTGRLRFDSIELH